MTELTTRNNEIPALSVSPFIATRVGLIVQGEDVPYEVWEAYGGGIREVEAATQWVKGDWLNYGERKYGEKYAQAMTLWPESKYQTLQNCAFVARYVEIYRRRENLSFAHHSEVASKESDEQDYWLDEAETNGWTRNELRQKIKESRRDQKPEPLPAPRSPRLIVGNAENVPEIESDSVDLIITSPPYNMGESSWPMGGNGRTPRDDGIGYRDELPETMYQEWQLDVLDELFRVAKMGASLFYNHKPRNRQGRLIHPMEWLGDPRNPWIIRQEIIWDRGSTHNHSATLFWPHTERVYWLTKGDPTLPNRPIGMPDVWQFHGPVAGTWHPAPFGEELPRHCIEAVGQDGITVLDPFAGSCTTLEVALKYGYDAIGVDISAEYLEEARRANGWTNESEISKGLKQEINSSGCTKTSEDHSMPVMQISA